MRKCITQWAIQGILFLVGVGVDVMPGNTSWIPSVVIWGIALLWLIGTIVYYIKYGRKGGKASEAKIGSDEELQEAIDCIETIMVKHSTVLPFLTLHAPLIRDCLQELQLWRNTELHI